MKEGDQAEDVMAMWTGMYSAHAEMVFQMLSRKRYTHGQIAEFLGCPPEAVAAVAHGRAQAIEANYARYLECKETVDRAVQQTLRDAPGDRDNLFGALVKRIAAMLGEDRTGGSACRDPR